MEATASPLTAPLPDLGPATSAALRGGFDRYGVWKNRLQEAVESLGDWFRADGPLSTDVRDRLADALSLLREDRLTIAFLGEFSRGKTELINALFFAGLGRRLLPSTAGRTTMCPTEIGWDASAGEPYLRLLPIETRAKKIPVERLKREPKSWVHFRLNPTAPDELQATLRRLTETKPLPLDEAAALGFSPDPIGPAGVSALQVPCWRHALISFPHPLLQQGLVVLDTPGLNALGSEPELTLSTLPGVQAILFVLAADTGVTRSDLDIWERHLKGLRYKKAALTVVLNKVDVLWDDLLTPAEIDAEVSKQHLSTAATLGLISEQVFAVSAQKALLARVKQDPALLARSAIEELEQHLSARLLEDRYALILDHIETRLGNLIETHRERLRSRIEQVRSQGEELSGLGAKSKAVIGELLRRTREEQRAYLSSLSRFESSKKRLHAESEAVSRILALKEIDELIHATHQQMLRKATTHGLSLAMKYLFDEMRRVMHTLTVECERLRRATLFIYEHFEKTYGFTPVPPRGLLPLRFRQELELLYHEAEDYRKSSKMVLAEQRFVVRRFFEVLVAQVRGIFERFAAEFRDWFRQALAPLGEQMEARKWMMEMRLGNLSKLGRSKSALDERLLSLQKREEALVERLERLAGIDQRLRGPPTSAMAPGASTGLGEPMAAPSDKEHPSFQA